MRHVAFPLAVSLAALTGCVHERTKAPIGTFAEGVLAPPSSLAAPSTWSDRAFGRKGGSGGGDARDERERSGWNPSWGRPSAVADVSVEAVAPSVASPKPRRERAEAPPSITTSAAPPAHRPIPESVSLDDVARVKFLRSTTDIDAQRVTLYVPRELANEVRLNGASVADDGPGRRTATGGASATLRRLTLRGSQVTIVARDDNPDIQLTARGDVSFHSDQPASVIDESGLKTLLLKNDGYTPLR